MTRSIVALFEHSLWANLRLLDAGEGLGEEQLSAGCAGTYGSVRDTLVHTFASEARYVRELTAGASEATLSEDGPFPGFPALRKHATTSGEALIGLAGEMPEEHVLRGEYRGRPYEMPASLMFAQAINHATEHRAHIATILSQQGVEPPRMDAMGYFTAGARA